VLGPRYTIPNLGFTNYNIDCIEGEQNQPVVLIDVPINPAASLLSSYLLEGMKQDGTRVGTYLTNDDGTIKEATLRFNVSLPFNIVQFVRFYDIKVVDDPKATFRILTWLGDLPPSIYDRPWYETPSWPQDTLIENLGAPLAPLLPVFENTIDGATYRIYNTSQLPDFSRRFSFMVELIDINLDDLDNYLTSLLDIGWVVDPLNEFRYLAPNEAPYEIILEPFSTSLIIGEICDFSFLTK
jgi:hypothetical protein